MANSDIELIAEPIKTRFEVYDDFYFSAIAFTIWDNIYGPRLMKIWKNEKQDEKAGKKLVPDDTLKAVANYTLTGEACRNGKLDGVETKFYCLSDRNIIATAFLFTVNYGNRSDLFSLLFVLPYSELSEWLSRHVLLCGKMKAILNNNLIPHVTQLYTLPSFKASPSQFNKSLQDYVCLSDEQINASSGAKAAMYRLRMASVRPRDLTGFIELAYSLRHYCLPDLELIPLNETYFNKELSNSNFLDFLQKAVTSHLETSCYTIVIGEDVAKINTMMKTLAFFMTSSERKLSRLVTADTRQLEYIRDLFVQGFVHSGAVEKLPIKTIHLRLSAFAPTLIDMNSLVVRQVKTPGLHMYLQSQVNHHLEAYALVDKNEHGMMYQQMMAQVSVMESKDNDYSEKHRCAFTVKEFFQDLMKLPKEDGSRVGYIAHFMRSLHRKAFSLHQYVEAEQDTSSGYESLLNLSKLMIDLSIVDESDLRVILGIASKMDSNIIQKVYGDRNFPAAEFAAELITV